MEKVKCPTCKGKGWVWVECFMNGKMQPTFTMPCTICKGKKTLNKEEVKRQKEIDSGWCKCKNPSFETATYHQQGHSHWWNCGHCGKTLQVG